MSTAALSASRAFAAWGPRALALVLWLLAAGSLTYWGLRLSAPPVGPDVPVAAAPPAPADPVAVARLLGAGATPVASAAAPLAPALSSRFQLLGVVAAASQRGAALIAVDGKPARPYRVGAQVDEGLVLQSVAPRRAALGPSLQGPPAVTLELPLRR